MGGTKTQIMQAPTTAAPSASQSAEDLYKTRLQYDPQTAALEYQLAQQYSPLYGALYQQTVNQQFPGLTGLQQTGMEAALGQLKNAYGMGGEDPYAQAQTEQLRRQLRETRNIGGNLYSGRGFEAEDKNIANLQQAFRTQAQQSAIPYLQALYPNMTQTPAVSQSTTPQANTLYSAFAQSAQPQYYAQPGTDYLSQILGIGGGLGSAYLMGRR